MHIYDRRGAKLLPGRSGCRSGARREAGGLTGWHGKYDPVREDELASPGARVRRAGLFASGVAAAQSDPEAAASQLLYARGPGSEPDLRAETGQQVRRGLRVKPALRRLPDRSVS